MSRNYYSSVIVFTSVFVILILIKSLVFLSLGIQASGLQVFKGWMTFEQIVWITWSVILLKYYHAHPYKSAFRTLIVSLIISVLHFFAFLRLMQTREIMDYYIIITIISLIAGIVYAISLISSGTRKKRWLKIAGIILLAEGLTMLVSIMWALNSASFALNGSFNRVEQWLSLVGVLFPLAFILHFSEEKKTSTNEAISTQDPWVNTINMMVFVVAIGGLYFSMNLILESFEIRKNAGPPDEYLRKKAEQFEAGFYVNAHKDTLRYRLQKPLNYDSTRHYPIVVCLHGSSGSGSDNVKQIGSSLPVPLLSKPENRAKYPAFLFVPQCRVGTGWGGIKGFPAIDSLVFDALSDLQHQLPIDTNRYYVAGNSLGGYGAWHFICTRPALFAAAIPISGGGDASLAGNIINIPVWAFHGAKDRNVPVSGSRDMIEAMKKAGANPKYNEYPDKAHNIWNEVSDTPGLLDWLFAQKRDVRKGK